MPVDMQSEIIAALEVLLSGAPEFGALVFEDGVMRVIDSADESLPDDFIVIQPGSTEEVERIGSGSVQERTTLNITLVTKRRDFAPTLRAGRLAVKLALSGNKVGLSLQGVQRGAFQSESSVLPGDGRRWAAHVMPLQITYVQMLK